SRTGKIFPSHIINIDKKEIGPFHLSLPLSVHTFPSFLSYSVFFRSEKPGNQDWLSRLSREAGTSIRESDACFVSSCYCVFPNMRSRRACLTCRYSCKPRSF